MFSLLKKVPREKEIENRVEKLFYCLISDSEFEFTELEKVQMINTVRRKFSEHLKRQKSDLMEQSLSANQKANEIKNALSFLE